MGKEKGPGIEYSFYDDGGPPKLSGTATLQDRFVPLRFDTRRNTRYQQVELQAKVF